MGGLGACAVERRGLEGCRAPGGAAGDDWRAGGGAVKSGRDGEGGGRGFSRSDLR